MLDKYAKESVQKLRVQITNLLSKYDTSKAIYQRTGGNTFSVTEFIQYYGDLLSAGFDLDIDLTPYRKSIIHFIPFAYSSDQSVVLKVLGTVTDDELNDLNKTLLDKSNDLRYGSFSYVYVTSKLKESGSDIESPVEVFLSLIEDDKVEDYDKTYALRRLLEAEFNVSKYQKRFIDIFEKYKKEERRYTKQMEIAELANEILIRKFEDFDAIEWRFDQILERKTVIPDRPNRGVYSPTWIEKEVRTLNFAGVLFRVLSSDKVLELFNIANEVKDGFRDYAWYLLRIVKGSVMSQIDAGDMSLAEDFLKATKDKDLGPEQMNIRDEVVSLVALKNV